MASKRFSLVSALILSGFSTAAAAQDQWQKWESIKFAEPSLRMKCFDERLRYWLPRAAGYGISIDPNARIDLSGPTGGWWYMRVYSHQGPKPQQVMTVAMSLHSSKQAYDGPEYYTKTLGGADGSQWRRIASSLEFDCTYGNYGGPLR